MTDIRPVTTDAELDQVRALCWEYRAFLLQNDPVEREMVETFYPHDTYTDLMARLAVIHARPDGIILGAFKDAQMVGCGMAHRLGEGIAEIKRVYIAPSARGTGAGLALMQALIAQIRADGYRTILLDTTRSLKAAHRLYRGLGFRERGTFYDVPPQAKDLAMWFELSLTDTP